MKRAPIIIAATAAGLAATLGFSPHPRSSPAIVVAASGSTPSAGKSITGNAISTQYGNVQLKVTVSGTKITNVEAVQLPSGDPKSSQISTYAAPMLRQSALTKQSASIDTVSGATYTSNGYATGLQSALDKAGGNASQTPAVSG